MGFDKTLGLLIVCTIQFFATTAAGQEFQPSLVNNHHPQERRSVDGDRPPGAIQVKFIPELSALLLTGHPGDVEQLIHELQILVELAKTTQPIVKQIPVEGDVRTTAQVLQQLYDNQMAGAFGPATITPILQNNAIMVIGKPNAISKIQCMLEEYESPVWKTPK